MTTVKLDPEDDNILEKLRAKMILRGKKMSKKDILGRLIKHAAENEDILSNDFMDQSIPLEEDPAWSILNEPHELEFDDTSTRIDEFVYK